MPGPTNAADALIWIQEAIVAGRYLVHPHFAKRCSDRNVGHREWKHAISKATSCTTYRDRAPSNDGTQWRVIGPDLDGDDLTLGCEAFEDHLGRRVLLMTVF